MNFTWSGRRLLTPWLSDEALNERGAHHTSTEAKWPDLRTSNTHVLICQESDAGGFEAKLPGTFQERSLAQYHRALLLN